jgi:hypothetical protein
MTEQDDLIVLVVACAAWFGEGHGTHRLQGGELMGRTDGSAWLRRASGALCVAAIAVAAALGPAGSASAHQRITTLAGDGSYAVMLADHSYIFACDQDSDGNRAYLRYYVNGVLQAPLYDPDGAGGNCGGTPINPGTLDSFNICVQNEGCGAPIYRGSY